MKIKNKIATLLVGLVLLTACSDDHLTSPTYTVGEADNAIVLRAGISEGGAGVMTRAAGSESHHTTPGHKLFTKDTKAALRIDGDWWKSADATSGELISKPTTATMGDKSADNGNGLLHNSLSMSPQLYWDDYGTADPNNTADDRGRKKGLTILGAAVNGETTAPVIDGTDGKKWTALSWKVGTIENNTIDQSGTNGWKAVDLLTSNNIQEVNNDVPYSTDGTYKFDDRTSGKLLEFTHAMSKITVNLTAGEGFTVPTNGSETTFKESVSVTLLSFNYMGKVDIEGKISTATKADGNVPTENETAVTTNIKAKLMQGGKDAHTAKFEALVFPGNQFTANIANDTYNTPTSNDEILMINADGNIYMVTAAQLVKAIVGTGTTGTPVNGTLEQGKNYVLNITVNKTDIDVTATIKDWDDVAAANEEPVINIADAYGHEGAGFEKNFDLYRSTTVNGSYISGITEGNHTVVNYVAAAGTDPVVPAHYDLNTPMYWPNHSTHYFFRGIWPLVDSKDESTTPEQLGPTTAQVKANSIEVANVAYKQGYYPSDLMIGRPRNENGTPDETCKVTSHTKTGGAANGICATEGKIRMNFQYAMSQVIVNLTTSEGDSKVIFDANTKVEIIGGYTQGEIKLSDESSDFTGKTVTDYKMNRANADVHTGYHDAIIPQSLQDGSGKATLKFRITVKSGDTFDKYETVLGIKDIKVTEGSEQKNITAWEPGKKYTYTLNITKSGVKVEATLKNWTTVTASEDVWF